MRFRTILQKLLCVCVAVVLACFATGAVFACTTNEIDVNGDGTNCQTAKFRLTTTNDATQIKFSLSAVGTFYVDCGDGGTLAGADVLGKTITRGDTTSAEYTCLWSSGTHTVKFGGAATAYSSANNTAAISFYKQSGGTQSKVASIDGDLSAIFPSLGNSNGQRPRFYETFYGCRGLTEIPEELFSGITAGTHYMFAYTFRGCTGLTEIPTGLFKRITSGAEYMFYATFRGCTGLTEIPGDLFSGITIGAKSMFSGTFFGCTGLTAIPGDLFSGISVGVQSLFASTFQNCTGLTAIPSDLFGRITTEANYMFSGTFKGCTNISGYIPASTFARLIVAEHQNVTDMWNDTFSNTNLSTLCPVGMMQYITGYENEWNGMVACRNACTSGYFAIGIDGCEMEKFILTTTDDATEIKFRLSASGTFYVDCGDGGTLSGTDVSGETITRGDTTIAEYSCSWSSAGTHTIKFGGLATGYSSSAEVADISFYKQSGGGTQKKIASISGSLSAIFPQKNNSSDNYKFHKTFYYATNLTTISDTLFAGITTGAEYMFQWTFRECSGLTEIPTDLFKRITTGANKMFYGTFSGCTGLTAIPGDLFSGITTGAESMFYNTFSGCTGLTEIPTDLFKRITTGAEGMFQWTFRECSGLTEIPTDLFKRITTGANKMFYGTFYLCTNLKGYIPPSTFAGLIANEEHQSAKNMWYDTFYGTQLRTEDCPIGTTEFDTGYKSDWGGYVSCEVLCDGVMYAGECHQMCSEMSTLHAGTYSYPVFADKTNVPSPVLHFRKNDTVCYVYMEADTSGDEHGLKVRYNDTVYHAIDPR